MQGNEFVHVTESGIPLSRVGLDGVSCRLSSGRQVAVSFGLTQQSPLMRNTNGLCDSYRLKFTTSEGALVGIACVYRVALAEESYPAWPKMASSLTPSGKTLKMLHEQLDECDCDAGAALETLMAGGGHELWRSSRYGIFVVSAFQYPWQSEELPISEIRSERDPSSPPPEELTVAELLEGIEKLAHGVGIPLESVVVIERNEERYPIGFPMTGFEAKVGEYTVSRGVAPDWVDIAKAPIRMFKRAKPLMGCIDPNGPVALQIKVQFTPEMFRERKFPLPVSLQVRWPLHQPMALLGLDALTDTDEDLAFLNFGFVSDLVRNDSLIVYPSGIAGHVDQDTEENWEMVAAVVYCALNKLGLRDEMAAAGAAKVGANIEAIAEAIEISTIDAASILDHIYLQLKQSLHARNGRRVRGRSGRQYAAMGAGRVH